MSVGAAPGGTLLAAGGDNHHFSFSLAVVGEKLTGKSALITCTRPPEQRDVGADTPDPMADHGVRCHAHLYESRGARYQILMWEVPGAPRNANASARTIG